MMMLLSWQEQEAANDIGVTSFTFLLINRGVGGKIDSQGAQSQHARQEKYPFLQRFQVFPGPCGYQQLNSHQQYWGGNGFGIRG